MLDFHEDVGDDADEVIGVGTVVLESGVDDVAIHSPALGRGRVWAGLVLLLDCPSHSLVISIVIDDISCVGVDDGGGVDLGGLEELDTVCAHGLWAADRGLVACEARDCRSGAP